MRQSNSWCLTACMDISYKSHFCGLTSAVNSCLMWDVGRMGERAHKFVKKKVVIYKLCWCSPYSRAGNNRWSPDNVGPNFENVRLIPYYDRTRWPNIIPAHLELSSSRCCQSLNYLCPVQFVKCLTKRKIWRGINNNYYDVLWISKNYFQHCM